MSKAEQLNKTIEEVWRERYVVPLYQRNFAWTEDQIGQLLQDIYDHSPIGCFKKDKCDNYYLGSLVLLQRRDGVWEVIDGQQRLTALHIICRYLGILSSPRLTYDSRSAVERFFEGLFDSSSWDTFKKECQRRTENKISRLTETLDTVENYQIQILDGERHITLKGLSEEDRAILSEYIRNKVILVCTPLPEDTDVAAYFEIMNNRGEQLQSHEIVKALLMRDLGTNQRYIFSTIWDACSQMDISIQKSLSKLRARGLFGENYDTLNLDIVNRADAGDDSLKKEYTIDQILGNSFVPDNSDIGEDNEDIVSDLRSIIDFPNFLMQAFRLYAEVEKGKENAVPLNSDNMPVVKPDFISDPMDFIKALLRMRVLFDKYVIKTQGDANDEESDLKWRLQRPTKYEYVKNGNKYSRVGLVNTFSNNTSSDNDEEEDVNNRIVKLESMLQVTFNTARNKKWLYALMSWLYKRTKDNLSIDFDSLLKMLEQWALDYYRTLVEEREKNKDKRPIFEAGTDTPHFLFNFIDYLYWLAWLASKQGKTTVRYANEIGNFQFRYYNSVEHHLPQSYENTDVDVDMIGNLCLISRRKNSSLNDKGPEEKAKIEEGLQPKRLIMYKITRDKRHWGKDEIEKHQREIEELIAQIPILLSVKRPE